MSTRLRDDPMTGQHLESDEAYFLGPSTSLFRLTTASVDEMRRAGYGGPTGGNLFARIATFERPYVISMLMMVPGNSVSELNASDDEQLAGIWTVLLGEAIHTNSPHYEVVELPVRRLLS